MRALLALLAAAALAVPAAAATKARVVLLARAPVVVRGAGFHHLERVRLTATGGGTSLRATVRASAAGAFTARFTRRLPACDAVLVRAVGSAGSRATLRTPTPDCAPL